MVDYIETSRRILAEHKHPSFSRDYMQAALDRIAELEVERMRLIVALKPIATAPCTGPNAFNRAALSDSDFQYARMVYAESLSLAEGED